MKVGTDPGLALDRETYQAHVELALTDAYAEYEQTSSWYEHINERLRVPFKTSILGVEATVVKIDLDDDGQIVALVKRGESSIEVPVQKLELPNPPPEGADWLIAYRKWHRGG